jgi:hypothetical protein
LRPSTKSCLNTFGFQATLIESLETLALFGLDSLLETAKSSISPDFCSRLGFVNRKELWERVIASFIGVYLITSDTFFLQNAQSCADRVNRIDSSTKLPLPLIHLKKKHSIGRQWENGTTLIDIFAGVPELSALYKISGITQYFEKLTARFDIDDTSWLFNSSSGEKKSEFDIVGHSSFDEYRDMVARAHAILGPEEIGGKTSTERQSSQSRGRRQHNKEKIEPRALTGEQIRGIRRESDCDEVRKAMNESIAALQSGQGFTGFVTSNLGNVRPDNTQHSSFFGDWLGAAGYALSDNEKYAKRGVFNSRGHLLYVAPDNSTE